MVPNSNSLSFMKFLFQLYYSAQQVLSPNCPKRRLNCDKDLKDWTWAFDGGRATYYALYPRAWTVYEIPELMLRLTCRQVSPVFPDEYKVCDINILSKYINPGFRLPSTIKRPLRSSLNGDINGKTSDWLVRRLSLIHI